MGESQWQSLSPPTYTEDLRERPEEAATCADIFNCPPPQQLPHSTSTPTGAQMLV